MPSRLIVLLIVLFWLAVNGWLFFHDLLPRLLPGQPPPYAIELVEEARTNRAFVNWSLLLDDKPVGLARTRVEHPSRDVFELVAHIKPEKLGEPIPYSPHLRLNKIESAYRVNAAGDLLGVSANIEATVAKFTLQGEVEAGQLRPHLRVEPVLLFPGRKLEFDLGTAEAPRGGAVLLPLHPVNRLRGLYPGQYWNVHLLDTVAVSLGALQGPGGEMNQAHASVREKEVRFKQGRYDDPCLVIDYDGDDVKVTTWVARRNGLVMRQETTRGKTRWTLYRE